MNKKEVNRQNAVRGSNSLTAYSSIDYNNSLSQYKKIVNICSLIYLYELCFDDEKSTSPKYLTLSSPK